MPSRWAGLRATAYVGVDELTLCCRGEQVVHPRQHFGGRLVRSSRGRGDTPQDRHYLSELARKPQAVRQVAPELVAELGEPFGRLWTLLEPALGGHEAARTLARLLRTVHEHGEERVREVLERVLDEAPGRFDELAVQRLLAEARPPAAVAVPPALRGYEVEAASAAGYDRLLGAVAR